VILRSFSKSLSNPAKDKVFFEINSSLQGDHNLSIISVSGQLVFSQNLSDAEELTLEIDTKSIPSGIYLAKVTVGDALLSKKFAIMK
jgi:hypothetical protein